MARSNSFKNWILNQKFANNQNLYIRLYTSAVALSDSIVGTEASYGGYIAGGKLIVGSPANWTINANQVVNAVPVTFDKATSGDQIIRYFAIWSDNVTMDESARLYWGQLSVDINVVLNVTPSFAIGDLKIIEN